MATAVADRTWRDSSPETIEADLAALWIDLARQAPVVRALMANLVIFRERPAGERIDLSAPIDDVPVDEVSRLHPSRVILLHHARGAREARSPIAAAIGAFTFGPPRARYGVEQIALRSTCAEASLPSIVRRLTLGPEDKQVRDWFRKACEAAGLEVHVDALGSMFGLRKGRDMSKPPVGLGSHLDTQPTGGKFDGVLGTLAALEVVRTLNDAGIETETPICICNWTNEEGSRFAPAMMASPRRRRVGVAVCRLVVVQARVHVGPPSAAPDGGSTGRRRHPDRLVL